mgnify:CR=1 FL=1
MRNVVVVHLFGTLYQPKDILDTGTFGTKLPLSIIDPFLLLDLVGGLSTETDVAFRNCIVVRMGACGRSFSIVR